MNEMLIPRGLTAGTLQMPAYIPSSDHPTLVDTTNDGHLTFYYFAIFFFVFRALLAVIASVRAISSSQSGGKYRTWETYYRKQFAPPRRPVLLEIA